MIRIPRAINYGHREAQGLLACYVANPDYGMVDLVNGIAGTRAGTADPGRMNDGAYDAYFDGIGDSWGFGTTALLPNVTTPNTIVVEVQLDSFVDTYPQIAGFTVTGGSQYRVFYSNDASYNDISFGDGSGTLRGVTVPSGFSVTGQRHWLVVSFDGVNEGADSSYSVWLNGELCAFTTSSAPGGVTNENRVGAQSLGSGDWNGVIRQVRLYNYAWNAERAISFYRNRGSGLFVPQKIPAYFGVTAAGGGGVVVNPFWGRGGGAAIPVYM
jgi:hypothetical protein